MAEDLAPRHTTGELLADLEAHQARARGRRLLLLGGGALAGLAAALVLAGLLREEPRPPPEPSPAQAAIAEPAPPPGRRIRPPRRAVAGRGERTAVPVHALAAPGSAALARPAGAAPSARREQADLRTLARSITAQKKGAVRLCFERELKRDPRLRGRATVTLELQAPGRIAGIEVQDDLGRPRFTRCVEQTMRSLQLPELPEDVTFELPFALEASGL